MIASRIAIALLVPSIAYAEPSEDRSDVAVGGMVDLAPYTRWDGMYSGDTAFGLEGLLDYDLLPFITIGISPRVLFHESAGYYGAYSGDIYELRARVAAGGYITHDIRLAAVAMAGYSWLDIGEASWRGVVVAGGIATSTDRGSWRLSAELTYEKGFQAISGVIDAPVDQLTLAVGVAGLVSTRSSSAAPEATRDLWLGPRLDIVPYSKWSANPTLSYQGRNRVGEGLAVVADYRLSDLITVGIAPRVVLHTSPSFGSQPAPHDEYIVDLPARATAGANVSPGVRIHAIAELGYSTIEDRYLVSDPLHYVPSRGLIFGGGVGAAIHGGSRSRIDIEVIYQFGRQSWEFPSTPPQSNDGSVDSLTVGLGVLTGLL